MNDEDTKAILNRRKFLIESTLAGAGLGALAAGCDAEPEACLTPLPPERMKPCLTTTATPVPKQPPPKPDTGTPPVKPTTAAEPQPCLTPPPPKPTTSVAPQPCLSPPPRPCLSIRRDP